MKDDVSAQVKHFPFATREVLRTCVKTPAAATVFDVNGLDDGTYDVIVIDARAVDDDAIALELAVTPAGRRDEVVRVRARGVPRSWVELIGASMTPNVTHGRPRVTLDRRHVPRVSRSPSIARDCVATGARTDRAERVQQHRPSQPAR
jgi:hypothetical protein